MEVNLCLWMKQQLETLGTFSWPCYLSWVNFSHGVSLFCLFDLCSWEGREGVGHWCLFSDVEGWLGLLLFSPWGSQTTFSLTLNTCSSRQLLSSGLMKALVFPHPSLAHICQSCCNHCSLDLGEGGCLVPWRIPSRTHFHAWSRIYTPLPSQI